MLNLTAGPRTATTIADPTTDRSEPGISEFLSEVEERATAAHKQRDERRNRRAERLALKDIFDQELADDDADERVSILHEMRSAQEVTLGALAELRWSLIRWIVGTGVLAVVLSKLL